MYLKESLLIVATVAFLSSCALIAARGPDFRLVSVDVVDSRKVDLDWRWRTERRVLAKITLTSDQDLVAMSYKDEISVGSQVTRCKRPDSYPTELALDGFPGVLWEGTDVSRYGFPPRFSVHEIAQRSSLTPPYTFVVYALLVGDSDGPDGTQIPYNVTDETDKSLCVLIRGGNMLGWHFASNTVSIPGIVVENALRRFKLAEEAPARP